MAYSSMKSRRANCPIMPISNSDEWLVNTNIVAKFQNDSSIPSRVIVRKDGQTDRRTLRNRLRR